MRKYRSDASSSVRFEYGIELHAGLSQFPETASAASDVLAVNDALQAQHQKRLDLRIPVLKARASLRFAEHHVDNVIRSAERAAQIEDGGRRGRICAALFPKGLHAVVRPGGKSQVKPTAELVDRLTHAQMAGIDDYRSVWLPKLKGALATLEATIAAHDAARTAHDDAFKAEIALRDAHHDVVDKVIGLVRAAFPRDRAMQDVIFPEVEEESGKVEVEQQEPTAPVEVAHG